MSEIINNENDFFKEGLEIMNNTKFDTGLDWSTISILIGNKEIKYSPQNIIDILKNENLMQGITNIGTFKKPYIYLIGTANAQQTNNILNNQFIGKESFKMHTYKPNYRTIKATLHWIPPNITQNEINTAFNIYGQISKLIDIKLQNSEYSNLLTTKKNNKNQRKYNS